MLSAKLKQNILRLGNGNTRSFNLQNNREKKLTKNQTLIFIVFYVFDLKDQFKWKKIDFQDRFKEIKQTWAR